MVSAAEVLVFIATVVLLMKHSLAINCYQCSGSDPAKPFQCNEWLDSDIDLKPEPCDNVYEAKYCIKHTGRFEGLSINCYQCSSAEMIECSDGMIHMAEIQPKSCDNVFEAQFCIKSTSLDGGIGAKRFCSSLDLGNYCNYVQQPGDKLTYRTCVFTCTGDGCNAATTIQTTGVLLMSMTLLIFLTRR